MSRTLFPYICLWLAETCCNYQILIPNKSKQNIYWRILKNWWSTCLHTEVSRLSQFLSAHIFSFHLLSLLSLTLTVSSRVTFLTHLKNSLFCTGLACVLMPLPCLPDFKQSEVLSKVHSNELSCDGFWLPILWQGPVWERSLHLCIVYWLQHRVKRWASQIPFLFEHWFLMKGGLLGEYAIAMNVMWKLVSMEGKVMYNLVMQRWLNGWHRFQGNVQM